ncbi:MAG: aromatic ring-hydroxylating dioxygenase subunit alpha [Chloroflexota bacterium]
MMTNVVQQIREELTALKSISADQARTMPPIYYTSPEFLALEEEYIFRREWVCIGHVGEIPNDGDFFTTELVGEPLLVVRASDKPGDINVLSNVCRHRGNIIAEGRGNGKRFTCTYHAWTYSTAGDLLSAPLMNRIDGFDKKGCSLPSFATEIWQGFIYVNLDGNATPLADKLTGLMPIIQNYRMGERNFVYGEETVWATNWKCLAENFMEGYHLTATHSTTLHPITPTSLCKKMPHDDYFTGYWAKYDPTYPERKPYPPELTAEETRQSPMFCVNPNHVIGLATNACVYMCLRPLDPDHVGIRWGVISTANPDDQSAIDYVTLCHEFNAEDKEKLETLQRGLKSRYLQTGYLAPADFEGTIWDLYGFVARRLGSDVALEK